MSNLVHEAAAATPTSLDLTVDVSARALIAALSAHEPDTDRHEWRGGARIDVREGAGAHRATAAELRIEPIDETRCRVRVMLAEPDLLATHTVARAWPTGSALFVGTFIVGILLVGAGVAVTFAILVATVGMYVINYLGRPPTGWPLRQCVPAWRDRLASLAANVHPTEASRGEPNAMHAHEDEASAALHTPYRGAVTDPQVSRRPAFTVSSDDGTLTFPFAVDALVGALLSEPGVRVSREGRRTRIYLPRLREAEGRAPLLLILESVSPTVTSVDLDYGLPIAALAGRWRRLLAGALVVAAEAATMVMLIALLPRPHGKPLSDLVERALVGMPAGLAVAWYQWNKRSARARRRAALLRMPAVAALLDGLAERAEQSAALALQPPSPPLAGVELLEDAHERPDSETAAAERLR
jgi:hypothetical protein